MTKDTKPYPASTVLSIIAALTLMAAMLLTSCGNAHSKRFLHEMDSLSGVNPKAAIHSIDTFLIRNASIPEGHRMRLMLTRERARNSAFQTFTSDSTAKTLAEYFEKHGTENEKMSAYYLLGCVYRDLKDTPEAIRSYNKALEFANPQRNDSTTYLLLNRIHGQMGDILFFQYIFPEAETEYRAASDYAYKLKDTLTALVNQEHIANVYEMEGKMESAIALRYSIFNEYEKAGAKEYAAAVLCPIIEELMKHNDYKSVKNIIRRYEKYSGFFDKQGNIRKGAEIYYPLKGKYFIGIEQLDSAKHYFIKGIHSSSDHEDRKECFTGLCEVFKIKHQLDSAIKYANLAKIEQDSAFIKITAEKTQQH